MKRILIRTGSGIVKGSATLVSWSVPTLRTTHNGDTRFKHQTGIDADGIRYETKSRGGGWRVIR